MNLTIELLIVFILGLMIGSYLNVVIYRLPRQMDTVLPRSHCTSCGEIIPWYHNIPLLSYLILRGKCFKCKTPFSPKYFFIELITGILFFILALSINPTDQMIKYVISALILCAFLVHFFIDLEHHLLLDKINIFLAILFLINSYMMGSMISSFIGAGVGFFFTWSISFLFYKFRRIEGLGGGDVKLFTVLGLALGPFGILMNLFLSSFLGSIVAFLGILIVKKSKHHHFAFGPYIILVAVLQIFTPTLFDSLSKIFIS